MDAVVKIREFSHDTIKSKALQPLQRPSRAEAEAAVRVLCLWAGDDPEREGLVDTPKRVVRAYEELFKGYGQNPSEILSTIFKDVNGYDDMVLVRDIAFASHCEHHMVPFIGKAHIAYFPSEGVIGLSKLARVVDVFCAAASDAGNDDGADYRCHR